MSSKRQRETKEEEEKSEQVCIVRGEGKGLFKEEKVWDILGHANLEAGWVEILDEGIDDDGVEVRPFQSTKTSL